LASGDAPKPSQRAFRLSVLPGRPQAEPVVARLLQLSPGAFMGGAERYALTIGLAAVSDGWEVHAAFPHTPENADLAGAFRESGVTTHPLDHRGSGTPVWQVAAATKRTAKLLGRVRPSVVHVTLPFPTFARGSLIACALRRVPTVVVFQLTPDRFEVGRSRFLYAALARAQVWVAVSEHGRGAIARSFGVPPGQITVIRNGTGPVSARTPSVEEKIEVRRELGLPDSAFIALSVGRLSKQKGHADIMPAATEAAKRFPHVHFVIAGEGEEQTELEDLIREYQLETTVHLIGQRTDVERLLRVADLFLFPSHAEGFPFALLEAAAHQLPIISADFGGAREIITHRRSGLLHPPGDTDSIWRCLEFAVQHVAEMRAMGQRAKRTADKFSRDEMVKSTLALLAIQGGSRKQGGFAAAHAGLRALIRSAM
jgi:glycosyltransferase involved in cell wall biosynthesis